ncbi:cyclophilin-like fold protein [Lentzea sp. NBC_00516]|uniref:cyclophilin-like fold protein n=1 Tax=Lentzea sp. NBC_00516 TaxID=2903582 RepID=UPI002E7FD125|nr:cyclophilin-like fold protein [Lentzea sp. NBC_00516]WUD27710.1 cyclophilin-like fold protein [Lentzea sp. NBC_00516]
MNTAKISAFAMILTLLTACGSVDQPSSANTQNPPEASAMRIRVTIGQTPLDARLLDNATARDFASLLPLTIHMKDLHGEEKYGPLQRPLAAGTGQSTHAVGDFGFWSPGTEIAVYYRDGESIPGPGIVMIGRIDRLGDALSQSDDTVDVTFSAAD